MRRVHRPGRTRTAPAGGTATTTCFRPGSAPLSAWRNRPASLIRAYEPQVVPGLLQTEGYVRAITVASFPAASEDFTERAVALRLARQQLLTRPEPPGHWVVLDETVLRRPVGGRKVMRAQLEHLITAPDSPRSSAARELAELRPKTHACCGC